MKIRVVGNYGNDNNGDKANLISNLLQEKEKFDEENEDITRLMRKAVSRS